MADAPGSGATRRRPRIDLAAYKRLTELADYFVPFAIRAICEIGVPDALASGPRTADELAAATDAHAPSLLRVLRLLARKEIFTEVEPGRFDLTALGDLLRSDHPLSLRDAYLLMQADVTAWAALPHSLRTGKPAFDHVHGRTLWEYLAEHPHASHRFDRGMQAMTRPELRAALAAYEWAEIGSVVDVGGGNGAFLAGLLARHGRMRGVLLDLPHVVAGAAAVLEAAGVAGRCRYDAPVQGAGRLTLESIRIGDRTIPKDRVVILLLGSANHDETEFRAPERLDVGRHPNRHVTFGGGSHHCLGAALARVEGAVVFDRLLARSRTLAPAGEPVRRPLRNFRSHASVPVAVQPA